MKTNFVTPKLLYALFASVLFFSCSNDDGSLTPGGIGNILITTSISNTDGKSGSSYMQLISKFEEQTLTNKNSYQIPFLTPPSVKGNDVFVFPDYSATDAGTLSKYTYNSESLTLSGEMSLPAGSGAWNIAKLSDDKAYVSMYFKGKIMVINPSTMTKISEIDLSEYADGDNNPDPGYMFIRDGILYVPLTQIGADYMPVANQVDVALINTKTDKVIKVISESASKMSFPTRPKYEGMIFTDENNDLYIACQGGYGMSKAYRQNGFVCIRSGKTEFDASATWDISNTTIQGTNYVSEAILDTKYAGNGKVYAFVAIKELLKDPYKSKYTMPVIIDLKAKTIKKIEGIPVSDGNIVISSYDNLVVFGVNGANNVGFYSYNPTTEKASNGPIITTTGSPTYFYIFK